MAEHTEPEITDPNSAAEAENISLTRENNLRENAPAESTPDTEQSLTEVRWLLQELEHVDAADNGVQAKVVGGSTDNQLVQVRLGTASSLFAALQCKHAATAGHCLRVALTTSAWSLRKELEESERDAIEVAALLHDIGMIGAPDSILLKAGPLDPDEAALMARARRMSLEILRQSCASSEILDIVGSVAAWYDGSRHGFRQQGAELPLGARMIAIAEAFDAMTTDHVYRPAMSHERAMAELFECAGTQFDPELVKAFAKLQVRDPLDLHEEVAGRWLKALDPDLVNSHWVLNRSPSTPQRPEVETLFEAKLLEHMYDAVVFIDAAMQVTLWNRGAERLTGIAGSSICQCQWRPELLKMRDEKGDLVRESECPVVCAIRSGAQSLRRLTLRGRTDRSVSVDAHAIPVLDGDGTVLGAIVMFHDASSEISLERRCQSLHEKATKDPLTQVANRAEFDRMHEMFVKTHQREHVPCSLIICDLDRFKRVNDTYGHQAGDDVIKSMASLLKGMCRPGDMVARYGGEEFVVLCADCDNATATRRAEELRIAFGRIPQPKMGARSANASFGVTEIQPGDTAETMLRRADRGLLMAKDRGRNMVVQLGSGGGHERTGRRRSFWRRKKTRPEVLIDKTLITPVPIAVAIEKFRGFVADHQAHIVKVESNQVTLEIAEQSGSKVRRFNDRAVTFRVEITFDEERGMEHDANSGVLRTKVHFSIRLAKNRERRRENVTERARSVLLSFQAYLMAAEEEKEAGSKRFSRAKLILAPWRTKRSCE